MLKQEDLFHPRCLQMDTSAIRRVFQLAASLENPLNLSIGQPHFKTPLPVIKAMQGAALGGKTAYTLTQGIPELRKAYAEKIKAKNGFEADPENLLVTSGVSSALQLLFSSTIQPGDEVLVIEPYFLIYRSLLEFYGAKLHFIPETFTRADLDRLPDMPRLKFIIFSNPSNPTGYMLTDEQMTELADYARSRDTLVVSDEIYELFSYDRPFKSFAAYYDQTLTFFGFSKSFSMTGLRLAVISGPDFIIQRLTTLQQYTVVCAPSVVQWAGLAALEVDMKPYVDEYRDRRDLIIDLFKQKMLSRFLEYNRPGGAFYFFFYINDGTDGMQFVQNAIEQEELLVVPGHIFTRRANSFRLSYAADEKTIIAGIEAIDRLLEKNEKKTVNN